MTLSPKESKVAKDPWNLLRLPTLSAPECILLWYLGGNQDAHVFLVRCKLQYRQQGNMAKRRTRAGYY